MMFPLLMFLVFGKIYEQTPFFAKPVITIISNQVSAQLINPNLKKNFTLIESQLTENEWFAGSEISGADIQMSFPIEAASKRAGHLIGEKTQAWLDKIHSRPAYVRALERGGQYDMNL
jgi:glutathione S-transferase